MTESFKYDYVFLPRARRDYAMLNGEDRAAVDRLIDLICTDPGVDGVVKFDFAMPPAFLRLFDDGHWAILYTITDPAVVRIWTIAPSHPDGPPRLRR